MFGGLFFHRAGFYRRQTSGKRRSGKWGCLFSVIGSQRVGGSCQGGTAQVQAFTPDCLKALKQKRSFEAAARDFFGKAFFVFLNSNRGELVGQIRVTNPTSL